MSRVEICSIEYAIVPATAHNDSEFAEIQRELGEIVSKLKATRDPQVKRRLLREMRLLLAQADRIIEYSE
jgi:hypothetical protein